MLGQRRAIQGNLEERFPAVSKIRSVVRRETQKYCDDVLAQAIGQAIGEMVRELDARFEAKLAALEGRPRITDDASRDQVSS